MASGTLGGGGAAGCAPHATTHSMKTTMNRLMQSRKRPFGVACGRDSGTLVILSHRASVALSLFLVACNPMVFARTGEIAPRGTFGGRASGEQLALEPQHVVQANGSRADSVVGFFPNGELAAQYSFGTCEVGLTAVTLGVLAEVRCGLLQQRRGDALSVAFSGAFGAALAIGADVGPAGRVGVDISRRFGSIEPLVDVYLSTSSEAHFVQTGVASDPVIGPTGVTMGRREMRLSVPVGFAIVRTRQGVRRTTVHSIVVGLEPWFVVWGSPKVTIDPVVQSYDATFGVALTFGVVFW